MTMKHKEPVKSAISRSVCVYRFLLHLLQQLSAWVFVDAWGVKKMWNRGGDTDSSLLDSSSTPTKSLAANWLLLHWAKTWIAWCCALFNLTSTLVSKEGLIKTQNLSRDAKEDNQLLSSTANKTCTHTSLSVLLTRDPAVPQKNDW